MSVRYDLISMFRHNPVVAAVKSLDAAKAACASKTAAGFILCPDIEVVSRCASLLRASKKAVLVHADFIEGLSSHASAIKLLESGCVLDGVISTKPSLIRAAKERGLCTVQRFFVFDSKSLQSFSRQMDETIADYVEMLPGILENEIRTISRLSPPPLIVGGLIKDSASVRRALDSGAVAVSTTESSLWNFTR